MQNSTNDRSDMAPVLHYFRTTPAGLISQPPLASSLQALETCFLMIGLERFPSALVSCASAWESALKAHLRVPPEDREAGLAELVGSIRRCSATLRTWGQDRLTEFREARNRIVHYGFSPKDDAECARLLLGVGLPFLSGCYRELFGFCLDWRDIRSGVKDFHSLSALEMERAALLPFVADQLRVALDVYGRAKGLRGVDFSKCFKSFGHFIMLGLKESMITDGEAEVLVGGEDAGQRFRIEHGRKKDVEAVLQDCCWSFDCPVCEGRKTMVAELEGRALDEGRLAWQRCLCVRCDFFGPRGAPLLTETLLRPQIEAEMADIRKAFGLK